MGKRLTAVEFGKKLRALRIAAGYAEAKDFAVRIGKAPEQVSRWENGKAQPAIDTLVSLAAVLGVDVVELTESNAAGKAQSATLKGFVTARYDWDPGRLLDILDRESRAAENRSEQGKLEGAAALERARAARLAVENARLFRFGIFSADPGSEEIARQGEEAVFGHDEIEGTPDKTPPSPQQPAPDLPRRTPRNGP